MIYVGSRKYTGRNSAKSGLSPSGYLMLCTRSGLLHSTDPSTPDHQNRDRYLVTRTAGCRVKFGGCFLRKGCACRRPSHYRITVLSDASTPGIGVSLHRPREAHSAPGSARQIISREAEIGVSGPSSHRRSRRPRQRRARQQQNDLGKRIQHLRCWRGSSNAEKCSTSAVRNLWSIRHLHRRDSS